MTIDEFETGAGFHPVGTLRLRAAEPYGRGSEGLRSLEDWQWLLSGSFGITLRGVKTTASTGRIYRERDEEPVAVACDFSAVYSLYLRPVKRAPGAIRIILRVTWEDAASENDGLRSCAFELDPRRERLFALGRKGNSMPAERLPAKWFCDWARTVLPPRVVGLS